MERQGAAKRPPAIGRNKAVRALHQEWSKSTLHEALLDLWLEHHGLDLHPSDLSEKQVAEYRADILRRATARQRVG